MKRTIWSIRILFIVLCLVGSVIYWVNHTNLSAAGAMLTLFIGIAFGVLTVVLDNFLEGFSLRGLSAVVIGLGLGALAAYLVTVSPFIKIFEDEDLFALKSCLYVFFMYMGTMIALRNREELSLVIPYVRFFNQSQPSEKLILDSSSLMDGRIAVIYQSRFITYMPLVPKFILEELQANLNHEEEQKQIKGRKGLETFNRLKGMSHVELKVLDSELNGQEPAAKIIFLAKERHAKILTTDHQLVKLAEYSDIECLNINSLKKALNPEVAVGQHLDVDLVKAGKEPHQGVGYLSDGSMVVVNEAFDFIGKTVVTEVISILPSAGGKMIFARLHEQV